VAIGPEPRYQLEITPSALKHLSSLPRKTQERIVAAIDALRFEPRPHGVKKLGGVDDLYRIRVSNYRVVYTIRDDRSQTVDISDGPFSLSLFPLTRQFARISG
jgi:mRNA interferase RelE/StbE